MKLKEFLLTYHPGSMKVPDELDASWIFKGNTRRDAERWVEGYNDCYKKFMEFIEKAPNE